MDSLDLVKWVRSMPHTIDSAADYFEGYNMARNLQAKLASSDTLHIYDINTASAEKFVAETKALSGGASVKVASTVREAAENSVRLFPLLPLYICVYMMSLFQRMI